MKIDKKEKKRKESKNNQRTTNCILTIFSIFTDKPQLIEASKKIKEKEKEIQMFKRQ